MNIFKSKTFWGAVLIAAMRVASNPTWPTVGEAIGIVVAAAGARGAIAKNGEGK